MYLLSEFGKLVCQTNYYGFVSNWNNMRAYNHPFALSKFFPPTDAQLDSLKSNFKFALNWIVLKVILNLH